MNGVNPQRPGIRFSRPSRFPEIVRTQSQCHTIQPPLTPLVFYGKKQPPSPRETQSEESRDPASSLGAGLSQSRSRAVGGRGHPGSPVRTGSRARIEDTEQSGGRKAAMHSVGVGRDATVARRAAVRVWAERSRAFLHRAQLWQILLCSLRRKMPAQAWGRKAGRGGAGGQMDR